MSTSMSPASTTRSPDSPQNAVRSACNRNTTRRDWPGLSVTLANPASSRTSPDHLSNRVAHVQLDNLGA